jgi:hypothetical protein
MYLRKSVTDNGSRRITAPAGRIMATIAFSLALAACGPQAGSGETMTTTTLESAKSKVMSLEQEIVAMVPEDLVISSSANDTSSLMRCQGEQKKWTGDAEVEVGPGIDREQFLDGVRDSMAARDGWKVEDKADQDGGRRVDLLHDDGTHLMVSFHDSPATLRVAGYSACFDLPEYRYGEKY